MRVSPIILSCHVIIPSRIITVICIPLSGLGSVIFTRISVTHIYDLSLLFTCTAQRRHKQCPKQLRLKQPTSLFSKLYVCFFNSFHMRLFIFQYSITYFSHEIYQILVNFLKKYKFFSIILKLCNCIDFFCLL